jgi:hypothetical protein
MYCCSLIPSNAALVGGYWERLLVLRLEQRQVAGREPPSEQRSEGQPGYLGESLRHLHPHRAPITATQLTDIRATRSRATHSRVMGIRATRDTPLTPVPQPTDTRAARPILPTPVPVMETPWLAIPAIALWGTGRLGPSTVWSLLAEFRPKIGRGREGDHTGDDLLSVTKARLKSLNDENNALGWTG